MTRQAKKRKNISSGFYLCLMSASALICAGTQPVLAACINTGGGNYQCSGTESAAQTISGNGLTITAMPDYYIDTSAINATALQLTSAGGAFTFTDDEKSVIVGRSGLRFWGNGGTNTSLDMTVNGTVKGFDGSIGTGIYATNYGTGAMDFTINGNVSGHEYGMYITSETASSSVFLYSSADSVISAEKYEAIRVDHRGTGGSSIILDGAVSSDSYFAVTAYNAGSTSNSQMIFQANNKVTGAQGITLTNGGLGSLVGSIGAGALITTTSGSGMTLNQVGTGDFVMTIDGQISAVGYGVNLAPGSAGLLHVIANNEITSNINGIYMHSTGSIAGNTIVEVGDKGVITSNTQSGISLSRAGSGTLTMLIDGYVQSKANSSSYASLYASHSGDGALVATINGTVTSGGVTNASDFFRSGSGNADITVNGDVTADDSGYGMRLRHRGSGESLFTVNGNVSSRLSQAIYYDVDANSSGTAFLVSGADSSITSNNSNAVFVYSQGKVNLDLNGIVKSNNADAISIQGGGEIYARINGQVTGSQNGLGISGGGTKAQVIIDDNAVVTGLNGDGLSVNHYGSDALDISVSGQLVGEIYGIRSANRGAQRGSINISGNSVVDGKSGTAIYMDNLANYAITDFNISGGQIIGDVRDSNAAFGKSLVKISGDFKSAGNFIVSDFDVTSDGHFRIDSNNIVNSINTVDVYGVFETAGTSAQNMRDMHVHNGGRLRIADTHVFNNGTSFTNDGTLSIGAGSVFKTDTMNAGNGVLSFDIASVGQSGFLEVLNGAANLTGQNVFINLRNVGGITEDDVFHIIHGQSTVIGGPGNVLTPVSGSSVLWEFSMVDGTQAGTDDKDVFVMAKQKAQPLQLADTANNQHAADVLTGLQGTTTDPELTKILSNLNSASTVAEFNAILESVQSAIDAGDSRIAMAQMSRVQNITNLRLENLRFSGADRLASNVGFAQQNSQIMNKGSVWATSFGEDAVPDNNLISGQRGWGGLAGQYGHQRGQNGIAGYKSRSNGAVFGVDSGTLFDDMTIGAAFGASKMRVRSDNINRAISKTDAYQMTLYGEHRLPYNSYVNAALSYAMGRNETVRHNVGGVGGLTANGKFDSHQWGASTSVGHHMMLGQYILTPSVHADWMRYNADSYTETGAGGAGLRVKSDRVDNVEGGVRVKLRREFVTQEKNSIIPEIRTGYRYDFAGEQLRKNLQFTGGGAAFVVDSPTPARHKFNIGGGVVYKAKTGMDFAVHYDLDVEKKFTAHSIGLRATYNF